MRGRREKVLRTEILRTFGGERGIRTLETLLTPTRFPIVRLRPAQPSLQAALHAVASATWTIIPWKFKTSREIFKKSKKFLKQEKQDAKRRCGSQKKGPEKLVWKERGGGGKKKGLDLYGGKATVCNRSVSNWPYRSGKKESRG